MTDSVSPQKLSRGREIPTRKVALTDASQLPSDYCTTPGGTIFSTTPGGTRLVYDRAFLLRCRDSPLAKSPPVNMEKIPGVTAPGKIGMDEVERENGHKENTGGVEAPKKDPTEEQFAMDI